MRERLQKSCYDWISLGSDTHDDSLRMQLVQHASTSYMQRLTANTQPVYDPSHHTSPKFEEVIPLPSLIFYLESLRRLH